MKSKLKSIITSILCAIIVFGLVFSFAACDPNRGNIDGLNNARFVAHFGTGVLYRDGENVLELINSRDEMFEFTGGDDVMWSAQPGGGSPHLYGDFCDEFFENHQLIFVSFLGWAYLTYEVYSISYSNNTLIIEFVTTTRPRNILDLGRSFAAIIEITRISNDLNIEFSHRMR